MRRLIVVLLLSAAVLIPGASPRGASEEGVEVVFLASEGFMVRLGHSKVLIDALFDLNTGNEGKPPRAHDHLPPDGMARLESAAGQFGDVEAVLVTHLHDDHFTAPCAASYMRSNGWAVLAGTAGVTGALESYGWLAGQEGERLVTTASVPGEIDTIEINGLTIYALGVRHTGCEVSPESPGGRMADGSPCMDHVAWLVESDGYRILHLGDAKTDAGEFERYPWLPGLEIDVAFVPFWFLRQPGGIEIINGLISPKTVVLMHWNSWNRDSVVEDLERAGGELQNAVIFGKAFEKRTF